MTARAGNGHDSPGSGQAGTEEFSWEWGLMPRSGGGGSIGLSEVLHHWFVRFNPLYFFSALCVLAGVFLVTQGVAQFEAEQFGLAQLALFAVVQAYEALLIAGCVFLAHRAAAVRPAVILALTEIVFLFDCTFRLESVADGGPASPWINLAWVALTGLKLRGLAAALRLRVPHAVTLAIVAAAAGISALVPLLSASPSGSTMVLQVGGWFGAFLLAAIAIQRPVITSDLARSKWETTVLERASRAVLWILTGFYFYHLWSYILFVSDAAGASMFGQAGAIALVLALTARRERTVWTMCAAAVLLSTLNPGAAAGAAFLAAGVLVYRTWTGGPRRLLVGAVFAAYAAVWLLSWKGGALPALPAALSWQNGALCLTLALIAWRLREPLAWFALAGIASMGVWALRARLFPSTQLGWGILLLALGFVALGMGVGVSTHLRPQSDDRGPAAP